jgi:hypothetical protein
VLAALLPWWLACAAKPPGEPPLEEGVVWIPYPTATARASAAPGPDAEPEEPPRARATREIGRQPNHWWFLEVSADDVQQRREWARVDASTWEERYPSGAVMRYRILGRISHGGRIGVVVRRVPDDAFDVFIPDLDHEAWPQMRVAPDGEWRALGPMHVIE